jgi:hypothetical protein
MFYVCAYNDGILDSRLRGNDGLAQGLTPIDVTSNP